MSDNIVNHSSELDRQLDVDPSDDDWSDVSSIFSDDTDVDPTYRPTISDSDDEEMPFSQPSTSRGNTAARPTPDNDQPASVRSRLQNRFSRAVLSDSSESEDEELDDEIWEGINEVEN
ncbi:hypothetical protein J6590_061775 [Homalodisca vitripennis]|nr:hypothetical protein J6590_061775 [Homalodisca vitripennis]